jgi:hypothetical protein
MDKYATHIPVLGLVIQMTKGPILELGMGIYSTPLLRALVPEDRLVVSVEENSTWARIVLEKIGNVPNHQVKFVPVLTPDIVDLTPEGGWGLVFNDGAKPEQRPLMCDLFGHRTDYLVCHDTESQPYIDSGVLDRFPYRADYKVVTPWTSVVSMRHEIRFNFDGVNFTNPV